MGRVKTVQISTGTSAGTVTGIDGSSSAKVADYVILDTDRIRTVLMTTGSTARVVTLPTAADNAYRFITVIKVDSGTGACTVDGEGAELILGGQATNTTFPLYLQYDRVDLMCDGTSWHIVDCNSTSSWQSATMEITGVTSNPTKGTRTEEFSWRRVGHAVEIQFFYNQTVAGAAGSGGYLFTLPIAGVTPLTFATSAYTVSTGEVRPIGHSYSFEGTNERSGQVVGYNSTKLAVWYHASATGTALLGSANHSFANPTIKVSFFARAPVTEFAHFR